MLAGRSPEDPSAPEPSLASFVVQLRGDTPKEKMAITCNFDVDRGVIESVDIDSDEHHQSRLCYLNAVATVTSPIGVLFPVGLIRMSMCSCGIGSKLR